MVNGKKIYEGDFLYKDYPGLPEITKEEFDRKEKLYANVTFMNQTPRKAIPAHTERWLIEWDDGLAGWKVPRDYEGLPDLGGWYKNANS